MSSLSGSGFPDEGYTLRPRYQPDWKPSWLETGRRPIECEDGQSCNDPLCVTSPLSFDTFTQSLVPYLTVFSHLQDPIRTPLLVYKEGSFLLYSSVERSEMEVAVKADKRTCEGNCSREPIRHTGEQRKEQLH